MKVKRWSMIVMSMLMLMVSCFFGTSVLAAGTASVLLEVSCTGKNTDEAFVYRLIPESTDHQNIQTDSLSLKDGGKGSFQISYDYPGTYHYTIYQEKGSDAKTSYDATVYTVDVYVTEDENGQMAVEPVVYLKGHDDKKGEISFVNEKKPEPKPTPGNPSDDVPKTGDTAPLALYTGLFGISGMMLLCTILLKKRKERTVK